jgi:hypothetical protein
VSLFETRYLSSTGNHHERSQGCSAAAPRICDAGPHVQHGDTAELRALDFDDVGDTLADHERGASLEDIDPRGYVS